MRYPQILSVHLFLFNGDKILLQRRKNTGYRDGWYSAIAGHVEARESATQAMVREAKEEIGIEIRSEWLNLVHVMHRFENQERVDFFFKAIKYVGETRILEHKADDLRWFPVTHLPENTVPYARQAIEKTIKGEIYSEYGWSQLPTIRQS